MKISARIASEVSHKTGWMENSRFVLIMILGLAVIVRAYHLGLPSLWNDEIIPPIMASKPLGYFLRWNWIEEMHPPLFFFLLKLVLLVDSSDFALRLPALLFGLAGVYAMYAAGKAWMDDKAGLLAAAVLAVNPVDVYFSRVVRFYAFGVLLCLAALLLLRRYMQRRDDASLLWLSVTLALLLLAEFISVMPIATFYVILLALILAGGDRLPALRRTVRYGILAFLVPGAILISISLQRQAYSVQVSVEDAFRNLWGAFVWFLAYPMPRGTLSWEFWLLSGLLVLGIVALLRTRRSLLSLCLLFFMLPVLIILAIRPGYCMAFWHLFFLLPVLALVVSAGIQALVPMPWQARTALAVSLLGAVALLGPRAAKFYTPTAYNADFKAFGKALASEVPPGSPVLLDSMSVDFATWYERQYSLGERLAEQRVAPVAGPMTLNVFLEQGDRLGHLVDPEHPVSGWAAVAASQPLGISRLVKAVIDRHPETPLDFSGNPLVFDAHPANFYGRVHEAERVLVYPYWGNAIMPAVDETPGFFSYRLTNADGGGNRVIELTLAYANTGKDNRLRVSVGFDDEKPVAVVNSTGPEKPNSQLTTDAPKVERKVALRREAPFSHMTLRVDVANALSTPHYPTSNLVTVSFSKLTVAARRFGSDLLDKFALDPRDHLSGFLDIEQEGERRWRWAIGPRNSIDFELEADSPMRLTYALVNPFQRQGYTLSVNSKPVRQETGLPHQDWTDPLTVHTVEFQGKAGSNSIVFAFEKINHVNDSFSEADAAPYVAAFPVLRLESTSPQ